MANCLCVRKKVVLVLFHELRSNERNKHQNNTRGGAWAVRHESAYIILFLTRIHKWRHNRQSSHIAPVSHSLALRSADDVSIADDVTKPDNYDARTWQVTSNSLDFDFIHSDIHGRSCKNRPLHNVCTQCHVWWGPVTQGVPTWNSPFPRNMEFDIRPEPSISHMRKIICYERVSYERIRSWSFSRLPYNIHCYVLFITVRHPLQQQRTDLLQCTFYSWCCCCLTNGTKLSLCRMIWN